MSLVRLIKKDRPCDNKLCDQNRQNICGSTNKLWPEQAKYLWFNESASELGNAGLGKLCGRKNASLCTMIITLLPSAAARTAPRAGRVRKSLANTAMQGGRGVGARRNLEAWCAKDTKFHVVAAADKIGRVTTSCGTQGRYILYSRWPDQKVETTRLPTSPPLNMVG